MNDLSDWLVKQLEKRGWSQRELGRRADISQTQISNVISKSANPGVDFCIRIAGAMGESPEHLLRMAGILPPLPPAVDREREAVSLFRVLSEPMQTAVIAMMRSLNGLPESGGSSQSRRIAAADHGRLGTFSNS